MSTSNHVPLAFGGPLTAVAMNAPLRQLDAAIATVISTGSGTATTLTAQALAGQASLTVASSTGFLVGDPIYIGTGATFESRIIATVLNATTITVTVNLTNTYAIGRPVSKSPVEIVDARGVYTTLGGRVGAIEERVFDVKRYGARGDGTTDDRAAIQAAINAANTAGGGTVYFPDGTYKLSAVLDTYAKIHHVGESSRNTTLLSGSLAGIIRIVGVVSATWKATQFEKLQFKNGSTGSGTQIMVDVQFVESEIVFRDCRFDGAGHGCQGVRLHNSWLATFENCYFAVFPSTTLPCVELRSTGADGIAGHPMNNIRFRDCQWQEVFVGVVLHNAADGAPGPLHSILFDNCLWKISSVFTGSKGIEALSNQVWGVEVRGCKFEDIERPIIIRGFNWILDGVYIDHCLTGIAVEGGGNHRIDRLAFSGGVGNETGTGVHIKVAVTAPVDVGAITQIGGLIVTTIFQNDAGLLGEDAMIVGDYGAAVVAALAVGAANRALYVPITVRRFSRLNGLRFYVGTASGNVSVGVFDAAGVRLSTSGAVVTPASGRNLIAFPVVSLNPGRYYLALSVDNITATFGMAAASAAIQVGTVRFQETAHPIPATATFAGETGAMLVAVARVAGSYIA